MNRMQEMGSYKTGAMNNSFRLTGEILACACMLGGIPAHANKTSNNMSTQDSAAIHLPSQGRGDSRVEYLGQSMDQLIYDFMQEEKIPGMTLAIVQAPYIPRVVGYGVSNAETGLLASTNTLWPAAEISQGYAAIAAFQLVEKGKMDIHDKISRYVAGLPEAWQNVSVLQLLQHSSGIPDYRKSPQFDMSRDYDPGELLSLVRLNGLEFPSGTDVRQSATNFLLLSMVIDAVAGMPYEEFVRENQFQPLGLQHTVFGKDLGAIQQDNVRGHDNEHTLFKSRVGYVNPAETAAGYAVKDGAVKSVPPPARSSLRGFSDIWSTPQEISFWDICLAGSILVKDEKHRDMIYKPIRLDNGKIVPAMAGWQFPHHKGLMDIKGGVPGFSSYICRFTAPSELVCVTLTANKEGVDLTNLARRIAGALDPKLGSGQLDDNSLYLYESVFGVDETMERIEKILEEKSIPVFARIDHGKNAREAGLEMPPSKVVIFGSPKVGTNLMLGNPGIATELPLRIAVWEDKEGSTWISFPHMEKIAREYGVENLPPVAPIRQLLRNIASKAANVY